MYIIFALPDYSSEVIETQIFILWETYKPCFSHRVCILVANLKKLLVLLCIMRLDSHKYIHTQLASNCLRFPFLFLSVVFLWRGRFFRVFLYHWRFLLVSRERRTLFPLPDSVFLGLDLTGCDCIIVRSSKLFYSSGVLCFLSFILGIKFVGRTSRGHTGGRSHRISHPSSFCDACLKFSREKDSAVPFPRRP